LSPRQDVKLPGHLPPTALSRDAHLGVVIIDLDLEFNPATQADSLFIEAKPSDRHEAPATILRPGWSVSCFSAPGTPDWPGEAFRGTTTTANPATKAFPDRRVIRPPPPTFPPSEDLEAWAHRLGLENFLGPLIPSEADRLSVPQPLWQYRRLNGEDLTYLPCTDIITHRYESFQVPSQPMHAPKRDGLRTQNGG